VENITELTPDRLQRVVASSAVEFVEKSQYRDELIRSFPVGDDITKRIELDIVRGKAPDCWVTSVFILALKQGKPGPRSRCPSWPGE
jgi:hypothetical protein